MWIQLVISGVSHEPVFLINIVVWKRTDTPWSWEDRHWTEASPEALRGTTLLTSRANSPLYRVFVTKTGNVLGHSAFYWLMDAVPHPCATMIRAIFKAKRAEFVQRLLWRATVFDDLVRAKIVSFVL